MSNDAAFGRFHRLQRQDAELTAIEAKIEAAASADLPDLERNLLSELLKKVKGAKSQKVDVLVTGYAPLTVKLRPSAIVDGCFVVAMPVANFLSMVRYGVVSRMKYHTKERETSRITFYQATLPTDSIDKALLFAAAPEGVAPYVTLATIPQRVINILKGNTTDFPFGSLLVSDDNTLQR
ncbi:MAG: hypothetical protein JRN68_01030 [Nitrososphaerota archaeon]|nr:hypothetical protein [Ferrimicrobium acidiphilum]MDG6933259.1 hypothetical protein [Nitrososphaerota archaeon]